MVVVYTRSFTYPMMVKPAPNLTFVLQVTKEHYLRDDIWSGTPLDPESDPASNKLAADAKQYLVVDTNVVLSQVPLYTMQTAFAKLIQQAVLLLSVPIARGMQVVCV